MSELMEATIATTTRERAEHMQRTLIGHTMSGEVLEQRPIIQYAGAEEFFDAAMRIYEILAIRLTPSVCSPSQMDVIACYRRVIFRCEACGKPCDFPDQAYAGYGRDCFLRQPYGTVQPKTLVSLFLPVSLYRFIHLFTYSDVNHGTPIISAS